MRGVISRKHQPLRAGQEPEIVDVVSRRCGHRMIPVGHDGNIVATHRHRLLQRPPRAVRRAIEILKAKATFWPNFIQVQLFLLYLVGKGFDIVLMRWITGPVTGNGKRLSHQHRRGLHLRTKDVVDIAFEAWTAPLVDNHILRAHNLRRVAFLRWAEASGYLY